MADERHPNPFITRIFHGSHWKAPGHDGRWGLTGCTLVSLWDAERSLPPGASCISRTMPKSAVAQIPQTWRRCHWREAGH